MSKQIQELFSEAIETSGAVGAQLSVIKDEEQLDYVYGFANVELSIPMTHDTVVQIGSTTKVFNAAMIMSLVEEGKLDLDVPVKSYIPEFEVSDSAATQTITLRHLLSMSAGLDNGDYNDYGSGEDAVAKRVAALKSLPQHFKPGAYWGYSNAGVDIAGRAAECVTGRTWDDLLKERVLQPAGLNNAASLDRDRVFQRVAVGHTLDPGSGKISVIRPWGLPRGLAPAGSTLTVSAHDLARFGRLFVMKGISDSGTRVLSEDSIKAMLTPQISVPMHHYATAWCLGPLMNKWDGVTSWGHHGGNVSGASFLYWLPERNGAIACTINSSSLPVLMRFERLLLQKIIKSAFGVAKPAIAAPETGIDIDLNRFIGTYDCLAGSCRVEAIDGRLVMKRKWKFIAEFVDTVSLIPLGADRFLIDKGSENDSNVFPEDMAFFGDNGRGRASNMVRVVFPSSRKEPSK